MADQGFFTRLRETVEDRTGYTLRQQDEVRYLEEAEVERRALSKELDMLGWTVLDHVAGQPNEVRPEERRKMARQAEMVWIRDPQAGAAVDLINDFVFGRGVPKPRAKDPEVQKVLDEVWDDPDNKLALTTYDAQIALGTTLSLTGNLFFVFFEGEDGKVKLGLLDQALVEGAVRDPDNRLRILYYIAVHRVQEWDYETDAPKPLADLGAADGKRALRYYEHLTNVEMLEDEGVKVKKPPSSKLGEGKIYHVTVNRHSEMTFGIPPMRRLIKWFAAYNDFMSARVDMAQAAAAFVMKRKVKGTPDQLAKMAAKAVSRQSSLAGGTTSGEPSMSGPKPAAVLNENELVSHENFALNTNSAQAQQDAQMIRAQISAGTRFPQAYYGDAANSSLATATSLELPILKAIEARQELFEGVFRALFDRAIERAVDSGKLTDKLSPEEIEKADKTGAQDGAPASGQPQQPVASPNGNGNQPLQLQQGYDGQQDDEEETKRDLTYEFGLPSPLKRALADLTTSIASIARTFDPNNTNAELSRTLLTVALGEGLEMQDPAATVDRIFPEGYVDPMLAAAQQQQQMQQPPGGGGNFFGPEATGQYDPGSFTGADGQQHTERNPYGAPGFTQMQQAAVAPLGRRLPPPARKAVKTRGEALDELWQAEVDAVIVGELEKAGANGNGRA